MTAGPQALHCVRAAFRMIYYGPLVHFSRPQEVPALFLHRQFTRLAYYDGPSPWTRGALRIVTPHNQYNGGPPAPLVSVTECWAAYLMPNVDWGVGIYFGRHADGFVSYGYGGRRHRPAARPAPLPGCKRALLCAAGCMLWLHGRREPEGCR